VIRRSSFLGWKRQEDFEGMKILWEKARKKIWWNFFWGNRAEGRKDKKKKIGDILWRRDPFPSKSLDGSGLRSRDILFPIIIITMQNSR